MATYTDWPDRKKHSISYSQHLANMHALAGDPLSLPAPPAGTYDPIIDYNAGAANRGYAQTGNDAQTAYEQGQQDYGLGLGDLGRTRDWTLADLLTNNTRANIGYNTATADLGHQYGILGHQQAQSAAQHGITSTGLLGRSAAIRATNQAHDQTALDTQHNYATEDYNTGVARTGTAYDQGKLRLDLGNARQFGGFNGQSILNPITGQPEFGSLITGLTRAGAENTAYQSALGGQRISQAQANGYVSPLLKPVGGISIGGTPLTRAQYNAGYLVDALLGRT